MFKAVDDEDDIFQVDDEINLMEHKDALLQDRAGHIKSLQSERLKLLTKLKLTRDLEKKVKDLESQLQSAHQYRRIVQSLKGDKEQLIVGVRMALMVIEQTIGMYENVANEGSLKDRRVLYQLLDGAQKVRAETKKLKELLKI